MTPDQVKFYTELMKSLTAFILGTGAGIYAILTSNAINGYLLIFTSILCCFSLGTFIALIAYLDKKIKP